MQQTMLQGTMSDMQLLQMAVATLSKTATSGMKRAAPLINLRCLIACVLLN